MTLKSNTFEGGTNGTTYSAGASGGASGDAFTTGAVGADTTRTWSTARAAHGAVSLLFSIGTGTANNASVGYTGYTATSIAHRLGLNLVSLPSVESHLSVVLYSDGTGVNTYLRADGTFRVKDFAGATLYTSPTALSLNTWYRIEQVIIRGTTTTNGTIQVSVYVGDSTTALHSYSASNVNTGTTQTISNVQWGRPGATAATTAYSFHIDDAAANDGATAFIGPAVAANVAPTANAGADQTNVEPWSTVTLTGTDSDSDGTIASRSWTQTGGSPTVTLSGTGATRTFAAPGTIAGTTLTFQYAATDNAGATTTDTMTVAVLPVTERAVIGGVEVPMQIRAT